MKTKIVLGILALLVPGLAMIIHQNQPAVDSPSTDLARIKQEPTVDTHLDKSATPAEAPKHAVPEFAFGALDSLSVADPFPAAPVLELELAHEAPAPPTPTLTDAGRPELAVISEGAPAAIAQPAVIAARVPRSIGGNGGAGNSPVTALGNTQQNQPPIAVCQDVMVSNDPGLCSAEVTAEQVDNGSSDPEDGPNVTLDLSPPGPYPVGMTTVTLTVTDTMSEMSTCVATITVTDDEAPEITLNGESEEPIFVECNVETFSDPGFTASDNCDGDLTGSVMVGGDTVDESTPGPYTVTYDVMDAAGNSAQDTVIVFYQPPDVAAFAAHAKFGSCEEDPPYDVYYGEGEPGTRVFITSEFGNGQTTVTAEGLWEVKVFFPEAPYNDAFLVRATDEFGRSKAFEFISYAGGA